MELHSINSCLSTKIKFNTNIILFEIPLNIIFEILLKINKNTASAYTCYEKYSK